MHVAQKTNRRMLCVWKSGPQNGRVPGSFKQDLPRVWNLQPRRKPRMCPEVWPVWRQTPDHGQGLQSPLQDKASTGHAHILVHAKTARHGHPQHKLIKAHLSNQRIRLSHTEHGQAVLRKIGWQIEPVPITPCEERRHESAFFDTGRPACEHHVGSPDFHHRPP